MVGDAALIHYTVFLIQHGWTPYRDFTDINMPGAYAFTALGMHLPGQPDAGWRLLDLGLTALTGVGYYIIARPNSRFASWMATALFLLVHGQDGVQQTGQRDQVIAVLLVLAVASLLEAMRRERWVLLVPFGVAVGLAATVKPTAAPQGFVLLALVAVQRLGWWRDATTAEPTNTRRARMRTTLGWMAAGTASMLVPVAGMLLWLRSLHALEPWFETERVLLPYYASLVQRPFGFTLSHSISPLLPLVLLWLLCVVLRGPSWPRFERVLIVTAMLMNLAALLVQGKALPYQRYPMLVFLLLLMALDLATAYRRRGPVRYVAAAGLCCACLVLAPLTLLKVRRFAARPQEFDTMLAADLQSLGRGNLNRRVQCLDTINECLPTLFTLRLQQATGTLYDMYLFDPTHRPHANASRREFLSQVTAKPPVAFIVVTGYVFDENGYSKLDTWPAFQQWLNAHYTLKAERTPPHMVRWWSRPQLPEGYRLYALKPGS